MNRIKLLLILLLSIGLTGCVSRLSSKPEPVVIPVQTEPVADVEGEDGPDDEDAEFRPTPEPRNNSGFQLPSLFRQSKSTQINSGYQLQSLPGGWTVDRHPVAKWGMSLPTVMSNVLDSAQSVEYWEDVVDLPTGYKLPLKRSKVLFQVITRLTIETVELHFINVDHVYSNTNHEPSHYILNGVVRGIELKPTGFPQLTADDVVKYKFLMTYGTPNEFSDGFHQYKNHETVLKVRELGKSHVQIQMNSVAVDEKLRIAIDDMYSEEGIEYQKKLLLRAIDF